MDKLELYSRVLCAITHDIDICDECRKCGEDGADVRVKLCEELKKHLKIDEAEKLLGEENV